MTTGPTCTLRIEKIREHLNAAISGTRPADAHTLRCIGLAAFELNALQLELRAFFHCGQPPAAPFSFAAWVRRAFLFPKTK